MTPKQIFDELFKRDSEMGRFILIGVALFAAVSIVGAFKIDLSTAIFTAVTIVLLSAFAIIVYTLVRRFVAIVGPPQDERGGAAVPPAPRGPGPVAAQAPAPDEPGPVAAQPQPAPEAANAPRKRAATVILVLFIILPMAVLAFSAAKQLFPSLATVLPQVPPIYCLVRPFEPCDVVAEQVAKDQPPPPAVPEVTPDPTADIARADYKVFVQFAGVIQRDAVKALMKTLEASGWDVQGTSGGGERTGSAAGLNTIKFGASDESAAKALAAEVQAVNVSGETISTTLVTGMEAGRLEVWISR